MDEYLDIRTLAVVSSIVSVAIFIMLLFIYLQRKTYPGFLDWVFAYLANSIGMILLGFRDVLPIFITIILANILIIFYLISILRGLRRFTNHTQKLWMDGALLVLSTLLFIVFTYIIPNVNSRIIIMSGFISFISFYNAFFVWKKIPLIFTNKHRPILFFGLLFVGIWHFIRLILTIFVEKEISNFMEAGTIQGISFLFTIIGIIIIGFSLVISNAHRIEQDLQQIQDEIKTLTGMLPICSHCKKIRNDVGDWEQLENYISQHSEAFFSHSLCPECAKKHYPEYFEDT